VHVEGIPLAGDYPRRILTAVLQDLQSVIKKLVDRAFRHYS
jgi:hypothetical protein